MNRAAVTSSELRWRVVIIDDSADDRADVRRLLLQGSSRRYELIEAKTAESGIRTILDLPSGPPNCVILDYHLPDAEAPEVLAELRRVDGDGVCPVVVVTGTGDHTIGRAVLRAGAQDYVGKAWMTAESLNRAVENAVERWEMAVELRVTNARLQLEYCTIRSPLTGRTGNLPVHEGDLAHAPALPIPAACKPPATITVTPKDSPLARNLEERYAESVKVHAGPTLPALACAVTLQTTQEKLLGLTGFDGELRCGKHHAHTTFGSPMASAGSPGVQNKLTTRLLSPLIDSLCGVAQRAPVEP